MKLTPGRKYALRWVGYSLLFLVAFLFQTIPNFLVFWDVRPLWLIASAVVVSMLEKEIPAAVAGLICGILMDMADGRLFGFFSLMMMVLCCVLGFLALYFIRTNLYSVLVAVLSMCVAICLLDFFFFHLIWGVEESWRLLVFRLLPSCAYTALIAAGPYYLFRLLWLKTAVEEGPEFY